MDRGIFPRVRSKDAAAGRGGRDRELALDVYVGFTWRTPDNGWSGTSVYQPAPAPIGSGRLGFRWAREGASIVLGLPLWLVAGVLLSGAWMLGKRGAPPPPGLCPTCGYDLRASPERCPECGTAVVGTPG